MKRKMRNPEDIRAELFHRYPVLECLEEAFERAYQMLLSCYRRGGKLLIAGNGGSAADSEHIAGELMKSFLFLRREDQNVRQRLQNLYGEAGERIAKVMEGALPAVPLTSMPAVSSAFANDSEPVACFAQMINALGGEGDVFWGISTSGNSENILLALMVAQAKGMDTILLTGRTGGKCRAVADVAICVPENETFKIQELHIPVYHALCAMLEAELFREK